MAFGLGILAVSLIIAAVAGGCSEDPRTIRPKDNADDNDPIGGGDNYIDGDGEPDAEADGDISIDGDEDEDSLVVDGDLDQDNVDIITELDDDVEINEIAEADDDASIDGDEDENEEEILPPDGDRYACTIIASNRYDARVGAKMNMSEWQVVENLPFGDGFNGVFRFRATDEDESIECGDLDLEDLLSSDSCVREMKPSIDWPNNNQENIPLFSENLVARWKVTWDLRLNSIYISGCEYSEGMGSECNATGSIIFPGTWMSNAHNVPEPFESDYANEVRVTSNQALIMPLECIDIEDCTEFKGSINVSDLPSGTILPRQFESIEINCKLDR